MDISIIIPVYNAEQYLRECLDSALAQTVKEKEIICIDDGSTDGSYLILQNYQADYKQIRVLRQGNSGPGKARNVGLENAKGEYVCSGCRRLLYGQNCIGANDRSMQNT